MIEWLYPDLQNHTMAEKVYRGRSLRGSVGLLVTTFGAAIFNVHGDLVQKVGIIM
jgi:hypothetical protein